MFFIRVGHIFVSFFSSYDVLGNGTFFFYFDYLINNYMERRRSRELNCGKLSLIISQNRITLFLFSSLYKLDF